VRDAWGIEIRDGYGQTETTCLIANSRGQGVELGSMGRPMPGYRIELLHAEGKPSMEGEVSLDLSDAPVGLIYAGDPQRTAEVNRNRFYRTGDIARRDANGYIKYVGRADDIFKSSDYRLSPFELESALLECPAIAEAAVVPSPDPLRSTVPKAFIVLAPGFTPGREVAREIFAFILERFAPYKRIRRMEFAALPKTISGKIRRAELRLNEQRSSDHGSLEFTLEDFPELRKSGRG
jgi:acetyl-CoA synthetase